MLEIKLNVMVIVVYLGIGVLIMVGIYIYTSRTEDSKSLKKDIEDIFLKGIFMWPLIVGFFVHKIVSEFISDPEKTITVVDKWFRKNILRRTPVNKSEKVEPPTDENEWDKIFTEIYENYDMRNGDDWERALKNFKEKYYEPKPKKV